MAEIETDKIVDEYSLQHNSEDIEASFDFFRNINIQFLIHEIKSPLNVLETNIGLLMASQQDKANLTGAQTRMLERSVRSAARMRNIIYTLLEVGRSEAGHIRLQHFNVATCATEVSRDALEAITLQHPGENDSRDRNRICRYLQENGLGLTVAPEVEQLVLHQDKVKFMFILGNLLRNSLKHRKSQVMAHLEVREGELLVSVSDDGPGITPENIKNLFRCYGRKRDGQSSSGGSYGHSLGLASSRILARYLGGDIVVNEAFVEGSQFLLRIPLEFDTPEALRNGVEVVFDAEP